MNLASDGSAPGTSAQQNKSSADTFVDASNEDFTLKVASAAIDNGFDLSAVFTDDNQRNVRSGTWDIGAYVFPLGPPPVDVTACTAGPWSSVISFAACDSFRLVLDGPATDQVKASVTVEFEES